MTALERRSVAAVSGVYVFRMLGLFMVLPVLSSYAGVYQGSTPALIGLALGVYGLTQALLQIPFGLLSDRIGRKPVLIGGLLLFAAGSVLAAVSEHIVGVIIGRALQGTGAIASTLMALLSDLTREQHRTKAMAMVGMGIGLSFALALVLGPLVAGWLGMGGVFALTAVLAGVGLVLLLTVVPSPARGQASAETIAVPQMLGRCLRDPDLLRLDFGIFALHFVMMAAFVIVPVLLQEVGFARDSHWMIYLPILLLSFMLMLPALLAAERRGKTKPVFLGAVALLVVTLSLAAALGTARGWLLLALLGFFVAFNLLEASLPSLVSRTVYAGGKGTAMGIYSSSQFFGAFAGGSLGGLALQYWGAAGVFGICVAVCLCWLLLALGMRVPVRLRSVVYDIPGEQASPDQLDAALRRLDGVRDVTVLARERQAYLKVDHSFDQAQLRDLQIG